MRNALQSKHNQLSTVNADFLDSLARSVCHDMGAPVRHIVQFSQLLLDSQVAEKPLNEEQLQWLSFLNNGGTKLQCMLDSLSQLGYLTRQAANTETVQLKPLFMTSLEGLKAKNDIHCRSSAVEVFYEGEWPKISACKEHWQVLLTCIIENALQFQPRPQRDKIKLLARCTWTEENLLSFSLEDNGIGIANEEIPKICLAFKRLHTAETYPGLGMGLTYCKLISELNRGHLSFSSSRWGGLQVNYVLPVDLV